MTVRPRWILPDVPDMFSRSPGELRPRESRRAADKILKS
jgi:hypothetical protein